MSSAYLSSLALHVFSNNDKREDPFSSDRFIPKRRDKPLFETKVTTAFLRKAAHHELLSQVLLKQEKALPVSRISSLEGHLLDPLRMLNFNFNFQDSFLQPISISKKGDKFVAYLPQSEPSDIPSDPPVIKVRIYLYDFNTGKISELLEKETRYALKESPSSISFSSDGRFLLVGRVDGVIDCFSLERSKAKKIFSKRCAQGKIIALDSFGSRVFAGDDRGKFFELNIKNGKINVERQLHKGSLDSLSLSFDGNYLASCGSDQRVVVLDLDRVAVCQEYKTKGRILGSAFDPVNPRRIAFSTNKILSIRDIFKKQKPVDVHSDLEMTRILWPKATRIYTTHTDGSYMVFPVRKEKIELGECRMNRPTSRLSGETIFFAGFSEKGELVLLNSLGNLSIFALREAKKLQKPVLPSSLERWGMIR